MEYFTLSIAMLALIGITTLACLGLWIRSTILIQFASAAQSVTKLTQQVDQLQQAKTTPDGERLTALEQKFTAYSMKGFNK